MESLHQMLYEICGYFCGQDATRSLWWHGHPLPFCIRCCGVYTGAFFSLVTLFLFIRPGQLRPPRHLILLSALTIPLMLISGLHLWDGGETTRFIVGMLFGFALGVACSVAWHSEISVLKSPTWSRRQTRFFYISLLFPLCICLAMHRLYPLTYFTSILGFVGLWIASIGTLGRFAFDGATGASLLYKPIVTPFQKSS